jgi:hypothetical protein
LAFFVANDCRDHELRSPSLVMPSPPFKKPQVLSKPIRGNQPTWEDGTRFQMSPIRANKCLDPIEEFPTEAAHPQPEIYSARPTRSVPKPKNCVEVTKLPPIFQPIFPYDYFNLIQSGNRYSTWLLFLTALPECWSTLYESDDNCVIGGKVLLIRPY